MKIAAACLVLALTDVHVHAQYALNWPTQPATPLASNVLPGLQTLKVSGVNDFLYTYDINMVEISSPISVPAFPAVTGAVTGCVEPTGQTAIATLTSDTQAAQAGYQKLIPVQASATKSLATSQNDWATNVKQPYSKIADDYTKASAEANSITDPTNGGLCIAAVKDAKQIIDVLDKANAKLNRGTHTINASFTAHSCKSEIVTVVEKFNGTPTGQTVTARLDAECNEFAVSGGVLMTQIQYRTYTASPSPAGSGNYLAVSGTGRYTPTLTSLFNFNFPFAPLGEPVSRGLGDVRLGTSTGPVLQLSSSQASSFGWFAGLSVSFLKYIYITPGEHFGQFADYPLGFTSGAQVPSGFGTLTPVKRQTARFGIAITIKGWNVSKSTTGGTNQPAVTAAIPPAPKSPK